MIDVLQSLAWWQWIIFALVLGAIETFIPGAVAIWFAASAVVIGLLLVVWQDMPWQWQWVLWAVLGIVAMVWYRNYKKANPDVESEPNLNRRGAKYVGQVFTLVEPIEQGFGKVRIGDGVWKVSGRDAPVGTAVRVTGVDGAVLKVEVS
jgi:membrane protein implicated in regulation of membrane protease activity